MTSEASLLAIEPKLLQPIKNQLDEDSPNYRMQKITKQPEFFIRRTGINIKGLPNLKQKDKIFP